MVNNLPFTWWTIKSKGQHMSLKMFVTAPCPVLIADTWYLNLFSFWRPSDMLVSCHVEFFDLEIGRNFLYLKEWEIEKWILNGILPGGNDSQQSGSDGLAPGVCYVAEYPPGLRFGKLRIISSIYKILFFCKFILRSNSFPGLFLLLFFWIWRECMYHHRKQPPPASLPCPVSSPVGSVSSQSLS